MTVPNEQTPNQSPTEIKQSEQPAQSAAAPTSAGPAKRGFDFSRFFSLAMLMDFINFKIMIIPIIIKYIYLLLVLISFFSSLVFCAQLWHGIGIILFPLVFIFNIGVLHIICEFLMLGFSMLDTLREIRNELIKQNEKKN